MESYRMIGAEVNILSKEEDLHPLFEDLPSINSNRSWD